MYQSGIEHYKENFLDIGPQKLEP